MFPGKLQFENFLNKNGITQNNLIIIYDQRGFFHPQGLVYVKVLWF